MGVVAFRVSLPEASEDEASGALWGLGTTGLEVLGAPEGRAQLLAYFERREGLRELIEAALRPLSASVEPVSVPEVDWVARFRESFRGFGVGIFRIAPVWDVPDRLEPGEHLLLVDPGRAFGTGTHETTRLCLAEIEAAFADGAPRRVLDVGTGTGILAIAAARLGAALTVGVENDPEALRSTRDHAKLNGVELRLVRGDAGAPFLPRSFDLVVANLTAPLLRAHAAEIAALVAPAGRLTLSGLLAEEAAAVASAFAVLGSPRERRDGEWCALRYTAP